MKSKPIAVLISDIHFNLNTLPLASQALKAALSKAEDLQVPLVIAGDLHDTKAVLRGEVMNRLMEIFKDTKVNTYILVGNHDLLSEKGIENALGYLYRDDIIEDGYCVQTGVFIVDKPTYAQGLMMFPYYNDSEKLKGDLVGRKTKILIMHQGFLGAAMGDYIQDKTSIDPELVKDFTVISGHYHRHQTIGTVTYIGSPFTMSFGEANDGPKGFLILNSDGTFTREILHLRRHIKLEIHVSDNDNLLCPAIGKDDLVWIKMSGPYSELQKLDKQAVGKHLGLTNFKLDLIPTDSRPTEIPVENLPADQVFDTLIDNTSESEEQKQSLKQLWRELI